MTTRIAYRSPLPPFAILMLLASFVTVGHPPVGAAHAEGHGAAHAEGHAEAVGAAGTEAAFVAAVNSERAAVGLTALRVCTELTAVARAHSGAMAEDTDLHHNPALADDVTDWRKIGENVGRGPSVDAIHVAFMASRSHARNVLDADWTQVGIGVVERDGRIWVTEVFRTSDGAPAPAPEAAHARTIPSPDPRGSTLDATGQDVSAVPA